MSREDELKRLAKKSEDKMDRKLFNFYKKALRDLKKETKKFVDEFEDLTFSQKREQKRKKKMMKEIDGIIKDMEGETQTNIFDYVKDTTIDSYAGVFYDLEGKTKMAIDFDMLNEKYIDKLVNKKIAGKNFSTRLHGNTNELAKVVKAELLDGAIDGKGYRVIAKSIAEQTESSYKNSLRIAKTEGHRVQSEATQQGYETAEGLGIEMKKQWLASLDDSTRDNHADLDGQIVGIDEEFEIDGYSAEGPGMFGDSAMDINCRCTTITIVDDISPKLRKDNINKEVIEYKNYSEWKKERVH